MLKLRRYACRLMHRVVCSNIIDSGASMQKEEEDMERIEMKY